MTEKKPRREYTKELRKALAAGYSIVVASNMYYPGPDSQTHEWPVVYKPRNAKDNRPWLALMANGDIPADGTGMRYSGRECTVESRYVIKTQGRDHHIVRDLKGEAEERVFTGGMAYREAELYALSGNRKNRCLAMGKSMESGG